MSEDYKVDRAWEMFKALLVQHSTSAYMTPGELELSQMAQVSVEAVDEFDKVCDAHYNQNVEDLFDDYEDEDDSFRGRGHFAEDTFDEIRSVEFDTDY